MSCFTSSKFLSNEDLLQYILKHLLLEQVIFQYILRLIYFLLLQQVLFKLRASSLLSTLNDASVDTADDGGYFQYSPKAKFAIPLYVHITFATDLKQNHRALHNCYSVKNM